MLTQDPSEPVLTPTHLITAQTAYLGACVVAAHPTVAGEALLALGAARIPDLGSGQSYPGRVLPPHASMASGGPAVHSLLERWVR